MDILVYWRDYAANWTHQFAEEPALYWHSSAKCIAELQPGDRMWMVTADFRRPRTALNVTHFFEPEIFPELLLP